MLIPNLRPDLYDISLAGTIHCEFHCETQLICLHGCLHSATNQDGRVLACGMYSSRKYSVMRHIENLHNGIGNIVSFIDYIAGRQSGIHFPNPIPNYLIKENQVATPKTRLLNVMNDELFRIKKELQISISK